nr:hypothetical protein [uncultured archaeon]
MTNISVLPAAILALHKLNKGKGKNYDQYPALKTKKRKVDIWWNSLDFHQKVEVGNVAIHFKKMSANYKWRCQDLENDKGGSKFSDLTNSQKRIVKFVFQQRSKKYSMFDLASLFGVN